MVRIPDAGRFEFRLMDGSANPYLLQAGVLAAGLEGIRNKRDPGKRLDVNMYQYRRASELRRLRIQKLPFNLLDALRLLDKSKIVRAELGDEVIDSYIKLRMEDWLSYSSHLTQWEREHTLDC